MTSGNRFREFESIIPSYYFYFLCVFICYFKPHDIYFQNQPGTNHLYGGFCPAFTGIPSVSSGIEQHPGFTKTKHSFYKEMTVCFPSRVLSHPFFILSHFSFKQLLNPPESYQNIQDSPEYYSILQKYYNPENCYCEHVIIQVLVKYL